MAADARLPAALWEDCISVDEIVTTLKTLWRFDYEPKVEALRDLYEVGKKRQWTHAAEIPWELETEHLEGVKCRGRLPAPA